MERRESVSGMDVDAISGGLGLARVRGHRFACGSCGYWDGYVRGKLPLRKELGHRGDDLGRVVVYGIEREERWPYSELRLHFSVRLGVVVSAAS
jgi:hypothetical protein